MDYPHHEGTFAEGGTVEYLRATLGAVQVPELEARQLLGLNQVNHWNLDRLRLQRLANRFAPGVEEILLPPTEDLFPRGDVHKPLEYSGA